MSIGTGGIAQMTYNNPNNNGGFSASGLGLPGSGFSGARSQRQNTKRLSVALPPRVAPISENSIDVPTPRTSRSHLLAGLRTQPKTPSVPASAPYHQTHHSVSGINSSQWADQGYDAYGQQVPQTASAASFDLSSQYAKNAGRQMYSLPEQVLAPPSMYEQEDVDPGVLQQMQMHSLFLAQRQQQLQQQLANITAATQGMNMNGRGSFHQAQITPQNQHVYFQQQQQQHQQHVQSPIEVPGQPGVYLVYNPAIQGYSYAVDQSVQQQAQLQALQAQQIVSPVQQIQSSFPQTRALNASPPTTERSSPANDRSFTPPRKAPSPATALEHVEPLPPPSATAFRRGHKKASSLAINAFGNIADGPKTASAATFGSQRSAFPPTPMTGTFGPGAARAGEHPIRQPRGPPAIEELSAAPTTKHEGSKNFATRQRRRALNSLMKAEGRRAVSRSSGGSPVSESDFNFDQPAIASRSNRKMSPIGSEMQQKRGSGSSDGYFGLSSASSSEGEDFKQPPTPAAPGDAGNRKKMMFGVLNAAEKRKSHFV
ncbi:hypothetical protein Slin15195_G007370 [Septoria linicola]|uniref:Uncharacterized protein n=1 Tax=Septoria linicola TaxID=215465 RepID=A0A9Q9EFN2_9PEZI|nr:hypothetical protein Slin14017_G007380 [Septoria linicola]USW47418.1 hypothetical protein Slin15195_G007370 [Septoria linicola]